MRLFDKTDRPTADATTRAPRSRVVDVLRLLWLLLLILPAASSTSATEPWDIDSRTLFGLSCWLVVATRLVLPARWFFPLSLPVALAAVVCMGADFLRHADVLELGLQWRTFKPEEVRATLQPYAGIVALGGLLLIGWCWACTRGPDTRRFVRALPIGAAVVTVALALVLPKVAWVRAWPLNAVLVAATAATHSQALLAALQPALSTVDPRDPNATWHARATSTAARQTLVFIVGESVRADFLRECHGPERVRGAGAGALVACDVTSGSDATHTSVPLLISREMPGRPFRVSRDATFERAFQEAGFETHWIGDQGNSLAWPDAQFQAYPDYKTSDEAALGPPLAKALARPAPRKAIVLHAYNAHDPYCSRFDPAQAPYPVDCERLRGMPEAADAKALRVSYADAVDASLRFVDSVIDTLRNEPGEAFLLFTPDHGDNLYDDPRQLYGHAMRNPTRWDVRVPAIFWANDAWRAAHPRQWANLQAQAAAPLMHADMVPTFLAAGGVVYDEPRTLAIDLLDASVPARRRTIQRALGATVDWDALVREAR
jgi:glucan phosphoethanolaminetransferase (alkaline phosphatase superfamily)